jgi:hypothetical protein
MIVGPGSKETEYNKIAYSTSKDPRTKHPGVLFFKAEIVKAIDEAKCVLRPIWPGNEDLTAHYKQAVNGRWRGWLIFL